MKNNYLFELGVLYAKIQQQNEKAQERMRKELTLDRIDSKMWRREENADLLLKAMSIKAWALNLDPTAPFSLETLKKAPRTGITFTMHYNSVLGVKFKEDFTFVYDKFYSEED